MLTIKSRVSLLGRSQQSHQQFSHTLATLQNKFIAKLSGIDIIFALFFSSPDQLFHFQPYISFYLLAPLIHQISICTCKTYKSNMSHYSHSDFDILFFVSEHFLCHYILTASFVITAILLVYILHVLRQIDIYKNPLAHISLLCFIVQI